MTLKHISKKRAVKTLIPYLFWTTAVLLGSIFTKNIKITEINFKYIFEFYVLGKAANYYFFTFLFILYLIIPLIGLLDKAKRVQVTKYIALVTFIVESLIPFIFKISNLNISLPLYSDYILGPLMYASIGYYLNNVSIKRKYIYYIIYIFGLIGFLTQCIGTYFLSIKAGKIIDLLKGYYMVPCFLYTISIFVLFKTITYYFSSKLIDGFRKISNYTFSVYLIHSFYLIALQTYLYGNCFKIGDTSYIYRFTVIFFLIPLVFMTIYLIRKIPIIKYILP